MYTDTPVRASRKRTSELILRLKKKRKQTEDTSSNSISDAEIYVPLDLVKKVWSESSLHKTVSTVGDIQLTVRDFKTLTSEAWLNDKVIDAYMKLIKDRSLVYVFSTFFYAALKTKGYPGVARWTSKINVFNVDLLLFPIHDVDHWSLVAVDLRKDVYGYFDSMPFSSRDKAVDCGKMYMRTILNYLKSESMARRKEQYKRTNSRATTFNEPIQRNENDCGVFLCCFAENLSHGGKFGDFDFTQDDIPQMRRQICYELYTGQLIR